MTDAAPTSFGQYQLIEKIAQGGMAEIFRGNALDSQGIERPVVIKRILPHIAASPEFVEMLVDEAKIAVMLSHGNIAQIYDLGKVADDYFIVMEYVEGKTLSQIMKRLRTQNRLIPISHAVSICGEIASGLDYMHRKTDEQGRPLHIVHRDISPQNIILSTSGTVKIIDFGIAKAKTKVSTTDSGILKGKFAYMSPEHAEGERLDQRSDIFSLGIILHELLTGQRLFKGKNNVETIRRVKKTKVPTPSRLRPEIPKTLDEIILNSLQRDRNSRYQSAHDLSLDLTRFLLSHAPTFSPRDLVDFLQELFPEMAPAEKIAHEETPAGPLTIQNVPKEEEPHEETVGAESHLIRKKLKETEVFVVPEKEPPPPEKPAVPPTRKAKSKEEHTERIKLRHLIPRLALGVGLVGLVLLGLHFYPVMKERIRLQAPEAKTTVVVENPPLPPPPVPPPPAPVAVSSILIESEPRGARIFVNDVDTNKTTPALLEGIAGREQKVGLHLNRYKFREEKVVLEAGQAARLSLPLELNVGELEINSLPPGAEILLNGKPAGKTPLRLSSLEPDSIWEVILNYPGHETWKGKVKIFGGKREVVNASLKKNSPDKTLP